MGELINLAAYSREVEAEQNEYERELREGLAYLKGLKLEVVDVNIAMDIDSRIEAIREEIRELNFIKSITRVKIA